MPLWGVACGGICLAQPLKGGATLRLSASNGAETHTLAPFETIEINPKGERKTK